jgi:fatty acid/phospholipid biosynthesis enzyme
MDELLGPIVVTRDVIAIAKHRVFQGRQIGDFAQLGGAMLIGVDGAVVWSHLSEDESDVASPAQILQAVAGEAA